jgi:hypothetical protein
MSKRFIVRLELAESAKRQLTGLAQKRGMTQVSVISRLVEWFAGQSDLIQAAVLGRYPPEIEADVAKLLLERMAKKDS